MYNITVCQLVMQTGVSFFFSEPLIKPNLKITHDRQGRAGQIAPPGLWH